MQELFSTDSALCWGMLGEDPQGSGQKQRLWLAVYQPVWFKWWLVTCSEQGMGQGLIPFPEGPLPLKPKVWISPGPQRGRQYNFVSGVLALNKGLGSTEKEITQQISGFSLRCSYRGAFLSHSWGCPWVLGRTLVIPHCCGSSASIKARHEQARLARETAPGFTAFSSVESY